MSIDEIGRVRRGSDVMRFGNHSSSGGSSSGKGLLVSPDMEHGGSSMATIRGGALFTTTVNAETQTSLYLTPYATDGRVEEVSAALISKDMDGLVPIEIESLLSLVLPSAPFIQCYSCMHQRRCATFTTGVNVSSTCANCASGAKMSAVGASNLGSSAKTSSIGANLSTKSQLAGFHSSLVKTGQ